jgi:molecular chaperone Hsp33
LLDYFLLNEYAFKSMILTEIKDTELQERLSSLAPDCITRFSLLGGSVKGVVLSGTHLAAQARANHNVGIIESLALSQGLIAGGLLSTTIKENTKINLRFDCSGPLKGFTIDADWEGNVRGYLFNNDIYIDKPLESFDLKPFIGTGTLSVTRRTGTNNPYTGHICLVHGRIAEDITEYFLTSEQTRTALALSVRFDTQGRIAGAGGLFFQAMPMAALPGAKDEDMEDIEVWMKEVPLLGNYLSEGKTNQDFLYEWFRNFEVEILAETEPHFYCDCNKDRFSAYLKALGKAELKDIIEKGPFPMDIVCNYCNSSYQFSQDDVKSLSEE